MARKGNDNELKAVWQEAAATGEDGMRRMMERVVLAGLIRAFAASEGMLQITPQMRILVAVKPVNFRKGIDSLVELCRAKLAADPFSGCLFVFRSRRATSRMLSVTSEIDAALKSTPYISCKWP